MPIRTETQWDLIVSGEELASAASPRAKENIEASVNNSDLNSYLSEGYTIKKRRCKKIHRY